jgi:hypothetical protein
MNHHWTGKAVCPCCKRTIRVSDLRGIAHAHNDKIGATCPMSGKEVC